jgi:SNF2 family DNA or RNA helicase
VLQFDDIKPGSRLRGLDPAGVAEVVQVARFGADALNLVFRVDGRVGERLVYRGEETSFEFVEAGRTYAFDSDGGLLRLASEAYRIRLAHLFDPYLAVSASQIEALPHQITAVYGEMLPRQPLRFLLADDPGAGKTIMAGLLIKELLIRGDLERCLIVAPGSLVEQWQEEMAEKFSLGFDILSRDQIEASITGNPFVERNRLIMRLDMAARSDELKAKLEAAPDWDLVICDEAHRMAASYFGGEVKETQRHKLGKLLGTRTRNLLLMSATPHNGKEADFQLFMGLLDADRFEGRFREGVHKADVSDMMRRLTKEELYRFDGTPLFPERCAYTASYALSPMEADLYQAVTTYVREEMNKAGAAITAAAAMSGSRCRSFSAGWRPPPQRFIGRWSVGASAWRNDSGRNADCAMAGQLHWPARPYFRPTTLTKSMRRPGPRQRKPRSKSSIQPRRRRR